MTGRELAAALREGRRVYGTCVTSPAPGMPAAIAGAGAEFVFIDTEHTPLDRETLAWMCRAYAALGLPPLIRIPEPCPYRASMALDGGAAGIIAPYVETVAQAQALRGAVKLRPLKGERLHEYLEERAPLEPDVLSYLEAHNGNRVMVINIESRPALDRLDKLVRVPGLDAVLVGPHDLSINLGIPEQYTHPTFQEAISLIIRTARAANVGVGIHYSWGIELELGWAHEGANLIMHSSDVALVRQALAGDLARMRRELGDDQAESGEGSIII